jgi:magnesium-transporting ATPase (P-type)
MCGFSLLFVFPSVLPPQVWEQVANILVAILLVAAVVSAALGDWVELGFILAVIVINVTIGLVQEGNAEKAAEALKRLLSSNASKGRAPPFGGEGGLTTSHSQVALGLRTGGCWGWG